MGVSNGPLFFMKILVTAPTIIGGVDYQPSHVPQNAPDHVAEHMLEIGNATKYETKILDVVETKAPKKSLSASQPDQDSPPPTVKKRRGRPPKSSQ
jgi:hypothetical protein